MAVPLLGPKPQFFDENGDPLSGGKVYTYEAGTSTPLATYTTSAGNVPNANPVILDSAGQANIWLGEGSYKVELYDADDVLLWTVDNYPGESAQIFAGQVYPISSNTTLNNSYDNSVIIASGTININLQGASTAGEGFVFSIYNAGTGLVTIDPDGSETINGASTLILYPTDSAMVVCDGTNWYALFKQGAGSSTVSNKTTTYSVGVSDKGSTITADATSGSFTVNLPAAATAGSGFKVTIKKIDSSANTVTIDPSGAETIDGSSTVVLGSQYAVVNLVCNGTTWYRSTVDVTGANTWSGPQRGAIVALTDGATVTPDFSLSNNFSWTIAGSRILANPTNQVAGQSGVITITQDATGGRAITSYGTNWLFPAALEPSLSTPANAKDLLYYYVAANGTIYANLNKAFG